MDYEAAGAALRALVRARRDEFVEIAARRCATEIFEPGGRWDPQLSQIMRDLSAANFDHAMSTLELADSRLEALPPEAVGTTRFFAHNALALDLLLQAYRLAHAVISEIISDEAATLDVADRDRMVVLRWSSQRQFAYFNGVMALVSAEYTAERERIVGSREQRRAKLVERVLAGEAVTFDELGYRVSAHHLGVVASGPAADAAIRDLARSLDRQALVISRSTESAWGWLGGDRPLEPRDWTLIGTRELPSGMSVAFGEPGSGPAGFKRTHEQAKAALRVAAARPRPVTRYADVGLLATALADSEAGHWLVETYLPGISGGGERERKLRATLRAYFQAGQNAASAAAALGVGVRTVGSRLRIVEERIGHPIARRQAELQVALELDEIFTTAG